MLERACGSVCVCVCITALTPDDAFWHSPLERSAQISRRLTVVAKRARFALCASYLAPSLSRQSLVSGRHPKAAVHVRRSPSHFHEWAFCAYFRFACATDENAFSIASIIVEGLRGDVLHFAIDVLHGRLPAA